MYSLVLGVSLLVGSSGRALSKEQLGERGRGSLVEEKEDAKRCESGGCVYFQLVMGCKRKKRLASSHYK